MAWLLRHWDRSRYHLAMVLYARTAGHRQLNVKVGLLIRWKRMTLLADIGVQVTLAALGAWAAHAWAQSNAMTARQVDMVMVMAFVGTVLAWEGADLIRKRYQAARGVTPGDLSDIVSAWIPCPFLLISDARVATLVDQLVAIGVPFHHVSCLLEVEARVLTWLLQDLSRAKLRQHDLQERLPDTTADNPSKPRF